jgi:hypothetical protein
MPQNTDKVIDPLSTYDVIELIGTSTESWEDAAKNVIEQAGGGLLGACQKRGPAKVGPLLELCEVSNSLRNSDSDATNRGFR